MTKKYWLDNESEQEIDPISSILSEFSDPEEEEEEFRSEFFQGLSGRRKKAAFIFTMVWGVTIGLHLVTWGTWIGISMTGLLTIQVIRLLIVKEKSIPTLLGSEELESAPYVSLLVSAKNEEPVIGNLLKMLHNLDYPTDKYEVWAINDHSTDKTPEILDQIAQEYPELKVFHRKANAGGGKSGALNQVLPLTKGEIIGVFDADATVPNDLLRRLIPLFNPEDMGAVQVRKGISNASLNFWTKGQMAEMALDSYFQQKRIAIGGIGELRGNGQFVRRQALESCGGWCEQTITDDLDLTIRLHLDGWNIDCLEFPAVGEEGVKNPLSLWHQRNRWAEGGYQRYLDYWRFIIGKRISFGKKVDLFCFIIFQYLLPTAGIPDMLMAIYRHRLPIFSPMTTVLLSFTCWGIFKGLCRTRTQEKVNVFDIFMMGLQSLKGLIYMFHWFLVIPSTMARMSVRPKRLKWVKTVHEGNEAESLDFT